jgi:hypothetical protein
MQNDHKALNDTIGLNTEAVWAVQEQMELQSYLMVASTKEEARARTILRIPKLLRKHSMNTDRLQTLMGLGEAALVKEKRR